MLKAASLDHSLMQHVRQEAFKMGIHCKRVRFPEDEKELSTVLCEIPSREDMPPEEVENVYFSSADYQSSRQVSKRISREAERQGHGKKLELTFKEKCSEAQENLNEWALHGHDRRGLERWANRTHGEERQQEQFQAIMTILQAQDEMLAERKSIDDEKLRKVSHKATKVSRHFARMLGKADLYAVEHERLAIESDADSAKTSATDISSSMSTSTEKTDDDISLPRIHNDQLKDSTHIHKSKRLYTRLPNFLQRTRSSGGKGTKGDPLHKASVKSL
jgi:hypothetical protein